MLKAATQLQTDVGEETKEKNATKVATRSCRLDEDHKDKVRRIFYQLSTGVETGRYFWAEDNILDMCRSRLETCLHNWMCNCKSSYCPLHVLSRAKVWRNVFNEFWRKSLLWMGKIEMEESVHDTSTTNNTYPFFWVSLKSKCSPRASMTHHAPTMGWGLLIPFSRKRHRYICISLPLEGTTRVVSVSFAITLAFHRATWHS